MKKKVAKKKIVPRVKRTRNAESMTEAAFFGMFKNMLRKYSQYWKPINLAKQLARRAYNGPNKLQKWEYKCNTCKKWFKDKDVVVDHIYPVGSLKCFEDLPGVAERMFCEVDKLQVLCTTCHNIKTKEDIIEIRKQV